MNRIGQLAAGLYHRLLGTYPVAFRAAFQEEMQEVFAQRAAEAAGEGSFHVAIACLRELKDYPQNLLREYWLAIQKKEVVMATTGSVSMDAGVCPRCGDLRPAEARYCPNCGRAFNSLSVSVVEQVRTFLNNPVTLTVVGALALLIVSSEVHSVIYAWLFYPRSYLILAAGLGAISFLTGWLLVKAASNSLRLGLILVFSIGVSLFFSVVSTIDGNYLLSEVETGQPVTYQLLGLNTYIERFESLDSSIFEKDPHVYFSPACASHEPSCLQLFRWIDEDENWLAYQGWRSWDMPMPEDMLDYQIDAGAARSAILVERSSNIRLDIYRLIFLVYVLGLAGLAIWASRHLQQRSAAAKLLEEPIHSEESNLGE